MNKHVPNYKVAQKIITNLRSLKITKLRRNYKVAQNNYKVAQELQSCAEITKLRRTQTNNEKISLKSLRLKVFCTNVIANIMQALKV